MPRKVPPIIRKLRAMATQDVSPHEAEIARSQLERRGWAVEPQPDEEGYVGRQTFSYATYDEYGNGGRRARPFMRGDPTYDEIMRVMRQMSIDELMRMFNGPLGQRRANPFYAAADDINEAVRKRQAEENESQRRARLAKIPCPGCQHWYADHIGIRCYGCYRDRVPQDSDRRADICSWGAVEMKDGTLHWYKVESDWATGPRI